LDECIDGSETVPVHLQQQRRPAPR